MHAAVNGGCNLRVPTHQNPRRRTGWVYSGPFCAPRGPTWVQKRSNVGDPGPLGVLRYVFFFFQPKPFRGALTPCRAEGPLALGCLGREGVKTGHQRWAQNGPRTPQDDQKWYTVALSAPILPVVFNAVCVGLGTQTPRFTSARDPDFCFSHIRP